MSRARDTAGIIQYNHLTIDDANDRVGIGSSVPRTTLNVSNGNSGYAAGAGLGAGVVASFESSGDVALQLLSPATSDNYIYFGDASSVSTGSIQYDHSSNALSFNVNGGTERLRIDSGGRLLIGTDTSLTSKYFASSFQPGFQNAAVSGTGGFFRYTNDNDGATLVLNKSRNTTIGSQTIVNNDETLGYLGFAGSDGTEFETAASITAVVDGTPGTNDMPGRLVFSTTADGASSPTEALRITSAQKVLINTTSAASSSDSLAPLQVEGDTDADAIAIFGRAADDVSEISYFENDKSTRLGEIQYQQGLVNFRHRVGYISFATGGTTERLRITTAGLVSITNDTGKFTCGSSDDLQIYHDGTNSLLHNDTGSIIIENDASNSSAIFIKAKSGEHSIIANYNGGVELYHDDSKKFETVGAGISVSGNTETRDLVSVKSTDGTPGRVDLYCEVNNAHYARLQAPDHADFSGNITVTLPNSTGTLLLANGDGSQLTGISAGTSFDWRDGSLFN